MKGAPASGAYVDYGQARMKTILLFFSVLLLVARGAPAGAEPGRSVVNMTETQGPYGGGRAYLPVRFGGVMGAMRLDTGASTSRIALAPWNRDFPAIGKSESLAVSGQVSLCDDVEARNVEIKAVAGANIGRAKYVVTRCEAGEELLGLDFFKGTRFTLNFIDKNMVFFDPSSSGAAPQPFQLLGPDHRLLGIALHVGAATVSGLFDTGAEVSAVDQQFVQTHRNLFKFVKHGQRADGAGGGSFAPDVYRLKKLDFGDGRSLRDVYVLVYDFGRLRDVLGPQSPVIVGYNLLRKFRWTLDFTGAGAPSWAAQPQ
jgi:Aspartyl protease